LARNALNHVVLRLRSGVNPRGRADLSDGELLERYLAGHDEAAFEALVRRHGPMVLAVCRRVAQDPDDADDAFQATFLVLVRKAASIRPRHKVGNWLYGVAYRAGMKVRAMTCRQRSRDRQMSKRPTPVTVESGLWDDLLPRLDAELNALPEKYRLPIVLCDLEGKTRREAARTLDWPEGTVAGRLAQGRAMLARRLTRKGLPVSAGVLAALLAQHAASAPLPAKLLSVVVAAHGAGAITVAVSAKVAALADGLVKVLLISKLKSMMMPILLTALSLAVAFSAQGHLDESGGATGVRAKSEPQTEKIIWGEPVGGLQMGIGFEPAGKRKYRAGDTVTLVVLVRNAADRPLPVTWMITSGGPLFARSAIPRVEDATGKAVQVYKLGVGYHRVLTSGKTLDPGAEVELGRPKITLHAEPPKELKETPALAVPPGKYAVHYEHAAWKTQLPVGDGLATPRIAFEVGDDPPKQDALEQDTEATAAANVFKRLHGTWNKTTLEIDGRPNARFGNIEPFYVFEGDRFSTTDHYGNVVRKGTVKIVPSENAVDLHVTDGAGKGSVLLLRYDLDGERLRLAFQNDGKARAKAMKTADGSGISIYSFRRVPALDDSDRRALQGTWTVVSQLKDGLEATKEYLALDNQWIFADDRITQRDLHGIIRTGTFGLYASEKPPALSLYLQPRTDPKLQQLHGIYRIKGNTLTFCFSNVGRERPVKFRSDFESNTTVVTLHRHRPQELDEKQVAKLAGLWHIDGNGFPGRLILSVQKDGKLGGHIYSEKLTGEYDPKGGRVVIQRYGRTQATIGTVVQVYTADFVQGSAPEPASFLKGTFVVTGGPDWGAQGKEYAWKAVRHTDHLKTVSISELMMAAHQTPGKRSARKNLDQKVIDSVAVAWEKQELLELYEELARRQPPRGSSGPQSYAMRKKDWSERTSEMVTAVKAVIANEKGAPARVAAAVNCQACHQLHRPNLPAPD
jgi:RNA polymerase sigma factor (sigma-70 family)